MSFCYYFVAIETRKSGIRYVENYKRYLVSVSVTRGVNQKYNEINGSIMLKTGMTVEPNVFISEFFANCKSASESI